MAVERVSGSGGVTYGAMDDLLQEGLGGDAKKKIKDLAAGLPAGFVHDGQLFQLSKDVASAAPGRERFAIDGKRLARGGTPPPNGQYNQEATADVKGFLPVSDKSVSFKYTDAQGRERTRSGRAVDRWLRGQTPEVRGRFMREHGLVQNGDTVAIPPKRAKGTDISSLIPGLDRGEGSQTASGTARSSMAQSAADFVGRNAWLAPLAGFATGGLGGLAAGLVVGSALRASSGGVTGLALAAGGLFGGGGGGAGGASFGGHSMSAGQWGAWETFGNMADLPGLAHNARSIARSHIREQKLDSMISMIDNQGIPIEDLIFMFMAEMTEYFEDKLRDKMREAEIALKLEERRERREKEANLQAGIIQGTTAQAGNALSSIGGVLGAIPGVGSVVGAIAGVAGSAIKGGGQAAANQIQLNAMHQNEVEAAMNGNMKSGQTLAAEVQMLVQKWKSMQEMMSNLLKVMHEMQMTTIRNIR